MATPSQASPQSDSKDPWPALPLEAWRQTHATLHMWSQIVGKVQLALTPLINHWWNVTLHVTSRGLSTRAMPCGDRDLGILFDFVDHNLVLTSSDGQRKTMALAPKSVAEFYQELTGLLEAIGAGVRIWPVPVEVSDPIPFTQDRQHGAYDREQVQRFWRILIETAQVFEEFRSRFIGKCSPVHFFWGSFDLAVTRFNGRRAPQRPGADRITREAYSHECISHGFWPGGSWFGKEIAAPLFYSYTAPEPAGVRDQPVRPAGGRFDAELSEFVISYDAVRTAPNPRAALMEFLQSTYEAGANCAGWDRAALERAG
ncbi:MAG TPA: DUF5996 family protein [Tepidisphaeraceae bacterium]|nr:DUF5996 family protein [Tepidisphaeraceae bacterium]